MNAVRLMALGAVDGWRTPLLVLLLALIVGMWLAGLINIARSRFRSPAARWGWVAVVTILPVIGFLIYWAAGGRYKIEGGSDSY
ncbi:MAG: PLD nuclease N-terminal domain-containing protein [Tunicatimonas sp.]